MFIEPNYKNQRSGWIELICGSMFSGKTEELIRRLKRAKIARQKVEVFKPFRDHRYGVHAVVSHDENEYSSTAVHHSKDILNVASDIDVVGIDEAQFFDDGLPKICEKLALNGVRVIVAGLDMDYKGNPFGPVPAIMCVAEYVTKLHAICPHCGSLATHSFRKSNSSEQVLVGQKDHYEPRCRTCFNMGNMLELMPKREDSSPPPSPELF
jgi:thymidine kinase